MTDVLPRARSFFVTHRRWFLAAGIGLLVYTVFGFLVLPWVLHRQLEKRLAATLHREVSIQRVRANPFAWSLTVDGFLVKDRDGSAFISWERLYLNVRLLPVFKRELALDALQLVRLHTNVVMARDGTLNFSDILTSLAGPEEPQETAPPKRSPIVFGVDHLAIVEAQLDFADLSRRRPFHTAVGPFTIRLDDFRTRPDAKSPYAFTGTTESGEKFSWSGSVNIDPIRSSGTFTLENIQLPKYAPYYEQNVGFDLTDGTARVQASYQLEWAPAKRVLQMSDGALAVRTLVVRLRGASEPKVELPELDVTGVQADFLTQTAEVGAVTLKGATVRVHRGADGLFDVTRLAAAPPPPATSGPRTPGPITTPPPSTAPAGQRTSKPFRWSVRRVEVTDQTITFDDDLPPRPVKLVLAPIAVTVGNLSSDRAALSTLAMSVGWNGKGDLKVDGSFSLWKPSADLSVHAKGLDLPSIDPYLPVYGDLDARLGDGRLAVDGRARLDLAPEPMTFGFEGDVNVDAFVLLDAERGQELLRWKALQILGIRVVSQPQSVAIRSIRWLEPRVKVQIAEDGSSNARRIRKAAAPPQAAGKKPVETKAGEDKTGSASAAAPMPVSIGTFQIVRGNGALVDRSVQPPALFAVSDLDVRVRGLSNDLTARAQVEVKGTVGGGELVMSGVLSPRFKNDATDLKITSKGIDLTPLGPYFGKYVGYELEKGKLDLDLGYKIADRRLEAQNVVKVDQLTLGEATHSPDATKLPVKLGLAVLQDPDGVIDLDVPVEGNIDDPDFKLGKLIWHAVGNVFTKIVTAPFALLGKLFGGGAERLDIVDFSPGSAEVDARADKTLQGLNKALVSRPVLKLEIEGTADPAADGKVLRKQALRRQAREAKWKTGKRGAATSPDTVELLEDEYVKFIEAEYKRTVTGTAGAKPDQKAPPPGVGEMEEALLERVEVGPEAVRALSQQRAEAARDRILKGTGQVDPARLFLVQGGERARKEGGAHVYFSLK